MEHDKTKLHGEEPFTIYHNTAPSMESAIEAFRENDSYRNKKIVKGTVLTHHVLSLHPDSKSEVTMDMLHNIGLQFISQFSDQIAVARVHSSMENVHMHFAISHNKIRSSETGRMSKNEFDEMKINFQEWVLAKYPELEASRIPHGKAVVRDRSKDKYSERSEKAMIKRLGSAGRTKKSLVRSMVQTIYHTCDHHSEFQKELEANGLPIYTYRGKARGVIYQGKKWTFNRICDISPEQLKELEIREQTYEKNKKALFKTIQNRPEPSRDFDRKLNR